MRGYEPTFQIPQLKCDCKQQCFRCELLQQELYAPRRIRMPTFPYLSALAQLLICKTEISDRYLSVLQNYSRMQPLAERGGCCLPDRKGTATPAVPASHPSVCCWSAGFCGRALGNHRRRVANERHTATHDREEGQVDGAPGLTRRQSTRAPGYEFP